MSPEADRDLRAFFSGEMERVRRELGGLREEVAGLRGLPEEVARLRAEMKEVRTELGKVHTELLHVEDHVANHVRAVYRRVAALGHGLTSERTARDRTH